MTAKEKAKELVDKYQIAGSIWYIERAKKYALICVDEIILDNAKQNDFIRMTYWQEVKQEIEKL